MIDKHKEKIEKYLGLAIELQVLWNSNVVVVPLVFDDLGALHEKTVKNFELLQLTEVSVHQLQKTVLLKTDTMLRNISHSKV